VSDPAPTSAPLAASDPHDIGSYRLVGRLGSGGMGVVFLALSPTGRYVALKRIRPELGDDPVFRARFRREVEAGRGVMGACVIRYLDADIDGDPPYLVTEYVDGPNLEQELDRSGPMPYPRLRSFAIGLAEAIESLHRARVTHRDLKPSNVLLAGDTPKVIDYGVSSAVEATAFTQSGLLVGSPAWMAPEQALGRQITPAVDVFSWAALVAYAGTGRPPFGEGRPEAVLFRIVHEAPDLDGVDPDLRPLVEAGLTKDPSARPGPTELIRRLAGLPTSKVPTPSRGDTTMTLAAALAPPPPPPPVVEAIHPPPPPSAPRDRPFRQPVPDQTPQRPSGRGRTWVLACLLVLSLIGITAVLAAYNRWGPFPASAPAFTPGVSNQPATNPSSTTAPNTITPQSTAPPFNAAAFQSPAFLLVKAAPASQVVSDVLARTLDCPLATPGTERVGTSRLAVTYNCAGGSFSFGTTVYLLGEPVVQADDSATILAGSPIALSGSPPAGVEVDQGTSGATWWVMSVGIIGASELQANDSRCTAASEPSGCVASLFKTAPQGTRMAAAAQFDRLYVQNLTYMFVQGYSLVPLASWRGQDELRVLIGQTISTAEGLAERAYFFEYNGNVNGFVGLDNTADSASITVVSQTNEEVTLQYALYDVGESTSIGTQDVRFEWNGKKLVALDSIPPSDPSVNGSRR
jgi:serine/threonine protein kinase